MPMMKTAAAGTTNITNIQSYLLKAQRQDIAQHQAEWGRYVSGEIQLSSRQIGHLKDYLGQSSRGLAVDVSRDLAVRNWARQMDLTRALHQHDKPAKQGRSRSYYHFILSPDPSDDCSLATLRDYAKAWCEENFRTGERLHEYAIVYHDDNAKGVLHAHVVVNVTNRNTGKKLHLDNHQTVALEISAQDIGKRFGLTPIREQMQTTIGARTSQPIFLDQKEREILNKGGYSWKWELRKFISDIAPLSRDFDDFKWKLNRAGYDVVRSDKTGYLTYTHRNGAKVRDSRLGSRFYMESLERVFNRENILADQTYSSWELIKISKGEVPWKEEIRRAIDAVAPTVISVLELQQELDKQYGIRLTVNRRGITYQHATGYKTRDTSIGFRYTFEGLQQNAVLGITIPYPGLGAILKESNNIVRHYLPRSARGTSAHAHEEATSQFVYRDITGLMTRNDLVRIEDIAPMLERRYQELKQEKAELVEMRQQLMRWNHLAVLEALHERDRIFLENEGRAAEPSEYNDTLIRFRRLGLYLREQVGNQDIKGSQKALNEAYEDRLNRYQEQIVALNTDQTIYQNFRVGQRSLIPSEGSLSERIDAQVLLAVGKTLAKYHVRDFFHLKQLLSTYETRLDLAQHKLQKAEKEKRELNLIFSDIRSYKEMKSYLPVSEPLSKQPASLNVEVHLVRFNDASRRLASFGLGEVDFDEQIEKYKQAKQQYDACLKIRNEIQVACQELKEAERLCQCVAESLKAPLEREVEKDKKSDSTGFERMAAASEAREPHGSQQARRDHPVKADVAALPLGEARRRREERLLGSPGRSRRPDDKLLL